MNPFSQEMQRYIDLQRLLVQIEDSIKDTLQNLLSEKVEISAKHELQNMIQKNQPLKSKLKEYLTIHYKTFGDSDERVIFQLVEDIKIQYQTSQTSLPKFLKSQKKEGKLFVKLDDKKWDTLDVHFEQTESKDLIAKYVRLNDKEKRYWYMTLFIDIKSYTIIDMVLNFIEIEKELDKIEKISTKSKSALLKKLSKWVSTLFFTKSTLRDLIELRLILNYIELTLNIMFPFFTQEGISYNQINQDKRNICKKCEKYLRQSLNSKEGYQPALILTQDYRVQSQDDRKQVPFEIKEFKELQLYHEECLFGPR